jgi:hypothetical protein
MYIKLRNIITPEKANKILEKLGIQGKFKTKAMNQEWLDEINSDPESHLKPEGRDLTMKELREIFKKPNFDLYFGRTSDEQMKLIAEFIESNQGYIKYVQGGDLLIDRGEVTKNQQEVIELLERKRLPALELPKELQTKNPPNSGILLCKSFSPDPFWVLYGKVDDPKFMHNRIYVNNKHNDLHRDKEGRGFMLIPLCPFGSGVDFFNDVYNKAAEIGLREHPNYFIARVYGNAVELNIDHNELAEEFVKYYTLPELVERFKDTFRSLHTGGYVYSQNIRLGFSYNKNKEVFKANWKKEGEYSRVQVLNALWVALGKVPAIMGQAIDEVYH